MKRADCRRQHVQRYLPFSRPFNCVVALHSSESSQGGVRNENGLQARGGGNAEGDFTDLAVTAGSSWTVAVIRVELTVDTVILMKWSSRVARRFQIAIFILLRVADSLLLLLVVCVTCVRTHIQKTVFGGCWLLNREETQERGFGSFWLCCRLQSVISQSLRKRKA
jgi:hypothetical protein